MNDLQRLLKLRGITMQDLADATGFGMHSVQKTVKGVRAMPAIQTAVAGHLGLEVKQCFGPSSGKVLRGLIAKEIKLSARKYTKQLKQKMLGSPTVPLEQPAVNG